MNSTKARAKRSNIEKRTNDFIVVILTLMVLLCITAGVAAVVYGDEKMGDSRFEKKLKRSKTEHKAKNKNNHRSTLQITQISSRGTGQRDLHSNFCNIFDFISDYGSNFFVRDDGAGKTGPSPPHGMGL